MGIDSAFKENRLSQKDDFIGMYANRGFKKLKRETLYG
jgi:hypothetical protein